MQHFAERTDGKEWCEQCESLVSAPAARACKRVFCKLKPLLPRDDDFADAPPSKARAMNDHPPKTGHKRDENGLTAKSRALLAAMQKRAGQDGTVAVSFNDVFDEIGCAMPSSVSPLMQCLIERRFISIVERKGGRAKTRYLVHGIPQRAALEISAGQPVEQVVEAPEPTPALRALMQALNPLIESCVACRFAKCISIGKMICRRLPPDPKHGYPNVRSDDWCGEFQKSA